MSSILQQIQAECAGALAADPYFNNVPVLTQALQNLGSQTDIALGSLGVCAVVIVPVADVRHPNLPGPYFEKIRILVRVVENVTVNQDISAGGTGKGALEVCEYALALLHQFAPGSLSEVLLADSPTIVLGNDKERLSYDVLLTTQGGLSYALPQFDALAISQTGETVTIAAATSASSPVPGAAVFYTTDGSNPGPRNGVLYTAPVAVSTGPQFRAIAVLAGYLPGQATNYSCL